MPVIASVIQYFIGVLTTSPSTIDTDLLREVVIVFAPHQRRIDFHQWRILQDRAHAVNSGLGLRIFARYVVRGLMSSSASMA